MNNTMIKFRNVKDERQLITNGEWDRDPEDQNGKAEWEQTMKQMFGDNMDRSKVLTSGAVREGVFKT